MFKHSLSHTHSYIFLAVYITQSLFLRQKVNYRVFKITILHFINIHSCSNFLKIIWNQSLLHTSERFSIFHSLQIHHLSTTYRCWSGCLFTVFIPHCALPSATAEVETSPCSQGLSLNKSTRKTCSLA